MKPLRILITNDDGYLSEGIRALSDSLKEIAHVDVVAPEQNSSGMSGCLTIKHPLRVFSADDQVRFVSGTPADSVFIALSSVLEEQPDLIVSGINNGGNLGTDTLYSGTVAAGIMGNMFGIPALAFSLVEKGWQHLETAAQVAQDLVQELLQQKKIGSDVTPTPWLLNVNVPNVSYPQLQGREWTHLGARCMKGKPVKQKTPAGEDVYWLSISGHALDASDGTDFHAVAQNRVSITPLNTDMTDRKTIERWREVL